ncbi:MAG: hypothetical protein DA408_01995 [Bacteroidetes bacterium]|nr:MAG: hypothetical protein C7N36_02875 [Bacteroidota bacterium]PTM14812.1 MAG: hypothetical protein DA408_01995 [Bacteroidota bacterium]
MSTPLFACLAFGPSFATKRWRRKPGVKKQASLHVEDCIFPGGSCDFLYGFAIEMLFLIKKITTTQQYAMVKAMTAAQSYIAYP